MMVKKFGRALGRMGLSDSCNLACRDHKSQKAGKKIPAFDSLQLII